MRRLRRIKILATLGPASSDSAMIRRLFEAGADVFRINMRHTSHDKMRELVKTIRNVESSYGRPIGILVDLQGPKLRLGSFAEGSIQLKNGESFVLDSDKTPEYGGFEFGSGFFVHRHDFGLAVRRIRMRILL